MEVWSPKRSRSSKFLWRFHWLLPSLACWPFIILIPFHLCLLLIPCSLFPMPIAYCLLPMPIAYCIFPIAYLLFTIYYLLFTIFTIYYLPYKIIVCTLYFVLCTGYSIELVPWVRCMNFFTSYVPSTAPLFIFHNIMYV